MGSKDIPVPIPVMPKTATTLENKTGGWRSFKPIIDEKKCTGCLACWIFCPEGCIKKAKQNKRFTVKVDYDFCKGCGICAVECPMKCVVMEREGW